MKRKISNKKKVILSVSSAVAVCAVMAGTTFGMLTSVTESKENKFTHGIVNIDILEEFDQESDIRTEAVTKEVMIENSTAQGKLEHLVPIYIRAQLVPEWKDAKGNLMAVNAGSLIQYTLNLKDSMNESNNKVNAADAEGQWILADDGYYYFTGVVDPEMDTDYLLMSVQGVENAAFPSQGHLEVEVLADAVQAAGNALADAWGNPTEDGKEIQFLK